jgi:hypothetical protein
MSAPMPAIVEELVVTPGNLHDGRTGGGALPDEPGDVHADSAYRGQAFATAVRAKGGSPPIALTGMWGQPLPRHAAKAQELEPWRAARALPDREDLCKGAAMACAACDGGDWPRPPCRSGSPPSPAT